MTEDKKPEEIQLLNRIRAITDERPTYGYPRVTALLRKELIFQGLEPINHKRVYRIMRENNLTLTLGKANSYPRWLDHHVEKQSAVVHGYIPNSLLEWGSCESCVQSRLL